VVDELFQLLLRKVVELRLESERLLGDRFVGRVVVLLQVRVSQRVLDVDSLRGVEGQHLVEQVERCAESKVYCGDDDRGRVALDSIRGDFVRE